MLIGIDWGGTKIEGVAMTEAGLERLRLREDTPRGDYDGCLATIARLVACLEAEVGEPGRVGVGIPGSLDPLTGLGKGASSTWILGRPVEADLRAVLGRDVRTANDADCLAASEARDGAGAGANVVFAVDLGSGVGGGVAVAGRAHHGPNTTAGDWGHNPLPLPHADELPGEACYCGKRGCIETFCSGRSFEATYARHAGVELKATAIVARARDGEHLARTLLDHYLDRVARGLSVVVNTLDPDVIILGGGMSNVDELYETLPSAIARYTFWSIFRTPIRRAAHGDSSGVRGAAWLWLEDAP